MSINKVFENFVTNEERRCKNLEVAAYPQRDYILILSVYTYFCVANYQFLVNLVIFSIYFTNFMIN